MRLWPSRSITADRPGAHGAADEVAEVAATTHRSPGLQRVIERLPVDRKVTVLDLGPAMSRSVAFFARFRCRLQIVDLTGELIDPGLSGTRARDDPASALEPLVRGCPELYDLVLAWDVFDHLEPRPARALARSLARACRRGASMLAFAPTSREEVKPPSAFAVLDHQTLLSVPRRGDPSTRPPISPAAFEHLLEGFRIQSSFVMRHGLHEWVAAREGEVSAERCERSGSLHVSR